MLPSSVLRDRWVITINPVFSASASAAAERGQEENIKITLLPLHPFG
jgi:hypothetical protein